MKYLVLLPAIAACGVDSKINHPPLARDVTVTVAEDGVATGQLDATDPDGDDVELILVTPPVHGTVALDGAGFTYTPAPDFHGDDALVFVASDGTLSSPEAHVTFRVTSIDDAPQLAPITVAGPAGLRLAGQLAATDADGDAITYAVAAPTIGTFVDFDAVTGRFVFEPLAEFAGSEELAVTAMANGVATTSTLRLRLKPVDFTGTWQATGVVLDGGTPVTNQVACSDLPLSIQQTRASLSLASFVASCGSTTITTDPVSLALVDPSPASARGHAEAPLGSSTVTLDVTLEPDPATGTYRFRHVVGGAFAPITITATLHRL